MFELGVGDGAFAVEATRAFPSYLASDIAPWAARHVRSLTGVDSILASALHIPLRSASVDAVVALDVLEHVDDAWAAVEEASRVLAPGGFLVISVPNTTGLGARVKRPRGQNWFGDRDRTHTSLLDPNEWRAAIANSRLEVLRIGSDFLWDTPYPPRFLRPFQPAPLRGLQVLVASRFGMLSWKWGENLILVAVKPNVPSPRRR